MTEPGTEQMIILHGNCALHAG